MNLVTLKVMVVDNRCFLFFSYQTVIFLGTKLAHNILSATTSITPHQSKKCYTAAAAAAFAATNPKTTPTTTGSSNNNEKEIVKPPFKLKKALIITKLTRLEFEKYRNPTLSDHQLEVVIRNRGTDYEALQYYHNLHKKFERKIATSFTELGVEVKLVNRTTINKDNLKWADMLVPVGGDGTFLLAAGRASLFFSDNNKCTPVVGFNSDPNRSEGRLMIPHQYSVDVKGAIKRILAV